MNNFNFAKRGINAQFALGTVWTASFGTLGLFMILDDWLMNKNEVLMINEMGLKFVIVAVLIVPLALHGFYKLKSPKKP